MAEKKTGLGRGFGGGINGMFPQRYSKKKAEVTEAAEAAEKQKSEAAEAAGAAEKTKSEAAEKAKLSQKAVPSDKKKEKPASAPASAASEDKIEKPAEKDGVVYVQLREVEPNRDQPRKVFEETALEELAGSIRQYGVIQPLIVTKRDDYYEIVAGERRWRAARMAGLKEIPVIIREYTDQEVVEIALIENIQREDLNPIEEAKAYQRLLQEFHMKQDELASRVSKSRTAITNSVRLLKLAQSVQDMLVEEKITQGHARALLSLENPLLQEELANKVHKEHMSVREIEKLVQKLQKGAKAADGRKKAEAAKSYTDYMYQEMEDRMKAALGTKVSLTRNENRGKIEIEYYSRDELERIYDVISSLLG